MSVDHPADWNFDGEDEERWETTEPPGLRLVLIPVPPKLAETFGYRGKARYVGFSWEPTGDELMYYDGRSAGTGNWYPFTLYREHLAVAIRLSEYNFGYSDLPPEQCLIIDREMSHAYAADVARARDFLTDQHPPEPKVTPAERIQAQREIQRLINEGSMQLASTLDPAEMQQAIDGQREQVEQMLGYLNRTDRDDGLDDELWS